MAFEFAVFVKRNPLYATKNWRRLSLVRKNMLEYRRLNPACEWCGRTKNLNVHHIIPVWAQPMLAWVKSNLVVGCRKCHLYVYHNGNYATRYEPDILEMMIDHRVAVKYK